jgi:hypothetical protein
MEAVTLAAAVLAALAALGAAWIASRSAARQIQAARDEGERTRQHADALARRAELQADVNRYTERAIRGSYPEAIHAMVQLETMAEAAELDEVQESAVYAALTIAHGRKFAALDGDDPPQLPSQVDRLDAPMETGTEEG